MAAAKLVRATASFACAVDGIERLVRRGEVLKASDPVVKGRAELFEAEVATAKPTPAPGVRRTR